MEFGKSATNFHRPPAESCMNIWAKCRTAEITCTQGCGAGAGVAGADTFWSEPEPEPEP